MIISYAQNREDIYINWLLQGKNTGFYVDIGASDPVHLSVTNFFYKKGWRGINIEPIERYANLLISKRPRDINLMLGVAKEPGVINFREYPDADGLSSFSKEMQDRYSQIKSIDYRVNVLPLVDIFKKHLPVDTCIDFMKIDVEGYEYEVIDSNDWEQFRPKLLIIEANHIVNDWYILLETHKYHKVFFDGLNEYFMPEGSIRSELYQDFPDFFIGSNSIEYSHYLKSQATIRELTEEIVELQHLINNNSWLSNAKYSLQKLPSIFKRNTNIKAIANIIPFLSGLKYSFKRSLTEKKIDLNLNDPLPSIENPVSQLCTQNQFDEDIYEYLVHELKETKRYHRKQWEFVYVLQAVTANGLLTSGKKALGFGVGKEPLPAVFAKNGVKVLATDLETELAVNIGWQATNQHAHNLDDLNNRGICDATEFTNLVTFQFADMNHISLELVDFDFCWSSCAFEHLGSIEAGLKFVENSLKCLKPGGFAIHTTEFNCQSNDDTLKSGGTVLFRQRDILELEARLKNAGHQISLNLNPGDRKLDRYIDLPPYSDNRHLKLQLKKYVATSIGIIVQKAK